MLDINNISVPDIAFATVQRYWKLLFECII